MSSRVYTLIVFTRLENTHKVTSLVIPIIHLIFKDVDYRTLTFCASFKWFLTILSEFL